MTDTHGVARDQLRAFIERIERLEEEKKTIADDIKDVFGEAKASGFDTVIMKRVIALRKKDDQQRMEEELVLDTYLAALGMIPQIELFDEEEAPVAKNKPAMALQSPRKAAEAVSERTANQVEDHSSAEATIEGQPSVTVATSAESAEDERNVEADGGAALVLTNSQADQPLTGGGHVDETQNAATHQAGVLVRKAPAAILRPDCLRPENCAGHGSTLCHACKKEAQGRAAA